MTRGKKLLAGSAIFLVLAGIGGYFSLRRLCFPAFRTVHAGILYRSGQPRGPGLTWLELRGIKTIVNLRNPDKAAVLRERAFAAEHGMAHYDLSLGEDGGDIAEVGKVFMALVNDESNWPILVHCSLGQERSGVLSALFRMEYDGWTPEAALAEARGLGLHDDSQVLAVEYLRNHSRTGVAAGHK